ncbi:unnamed protein product [Nippostrongylus brasiliensis]|uniref:Endo/exonuclease/phosphatase domain-containing protein n=1 Tax=Nippostrongylus brasiliensis TaxID=27835 RepID=A0A0N4YLP4_NIPBR|nr:unnamed protein product [Nippostrongylus brasiliensis]
MVAVAGDLNRHVGISKDGFKCHGRFGYGIRNEDGERILEYACSHNLAVTNTRFRKRPSHLISFYSGNTRSQFDYVLVRRRDAKLVSDAEIVPYETVATLHRPLHNENHTAKTRVGRACWPVTKEVERRLGVMEMKMLRWLAGVTRLDRVTNADIRERFGVVPIAEKLRETRLRWYGHVLWASDDTVCRIGLALDVPGTRPRGRPKQRWLDTIHADLKAVGVHPDHAYDRSLWRQKIGRADPASKRERR